MNWLGNQGDPGTREWWQALFEADSRTPSAMSSAASRSFQTYLYSLTDGAVSFILNDGFFKRASNLMMVFAEIADMLQLTTEEVVSPQES